MHVASIPVRTVETERAVEQKEVSQHACRNARRVLSLRVPRLLPDYCRSACIGNHNESRPVE